MLRRLLQTLLTLTLVVGSIEICMAQTGGSIKGTVADANGALVAGANVEAVNDNTGEKRGTTTADNGTYNINNLAVGIYTVTANATGFSGATNKEVKVSVAFATDVSFVLSVGGATANVIVTSGDVQTQVNTNDQQLSTLLDNKKIIDLPLLNRNPNSLVLLAPGPCKPTVRWVVSQSMDLANEITTSWLTGSIITTPKSPAFQWRVVAEY